MCTSSIRQIRDWITHCTRNHHHCQQTQDLSAKAAGKKFFLPSRLLDVGCVNGNPHIRVRNTSDFKAGTVYVTLSHCWGRNPVISLLDSNITEFQRSIPLQSLSKTFRDAVEVTRGLGYQYLWIDSLCIIRKSSDDWHRESASIGDIYSNAILNIAATTSVDGNGGLFQHSKSLALNPCLVNPKEKLTDESAFICNPSDSWRDTIEKSPLAKRGWVIQERILSTRVVHFAEDQVRWECQSCRDCEFSPGLDYSSKNLDVLTARSTKSVDIYDNWETTVNRYTQCRLTVKSDKFVALVGLARRTCQQLGVVPTDYLAGIWRANMPAGLLWRTMPHDSYRKRDLDRAPSWSWACVDGEILMPETGFLTGHHLGLNGRMANITYRHVRGTNKAYCQFISADVRHLGDHFGTVTEGSIILNGPLCAIRTIGPEGGNSFRELNCGIIDCTNDVVSITTSSIRWDEKDACLEGMNTQVYFLLIEESLGWCSGLVLRPMKSEQGTYQRLGQILARPSSLVTLLGISRNPDLLKSHRYLAADPTYGFTIKIK